jgi:hypothetical protein
VGAEFHGIGSYSASRVPNHRKLYVIENKVLAIKSLQVRQPEAAKRCIQDTSFCVSLRTTRAAFWGKIVVLEAMPTTENLGGRAI